MKQVARLYVTALAALVASACSDSTAPEVRSAAVVEVARGQHQVGVAGSAVAEAPAVLVLDGRGRGMPDVLVRFDVISGGGALGASSARTDATGLATAQSWTLGAAGLNEVAARVNGLDAVVFSATAEAVATLPADEGGTGGPGAGTTPLPAPPTPTGAFDIEVRYVSAPTARQRAAVDAAVARWRGVILSELPDVPVNAAANTCFEGQPAVNSVVDDLLLFVNFAPIDGAGKVLGSAGPCLIRSVSNLPVVGFLNLDAADLVQMESVGTLDDVVLHEIGHVLGIGTLWSMGGLVTGAGGTDPHFTGASALAAYQGLGGTLAAIPVENTGSTGTRDGHWRESVFGNELMTGYIRGTPNPLSALTIASLLDLGYGTTQGAAATYTLGGQSAGLEEGLDLHGREDVVRPKYRVDPAGRKYRIPLEVP